MLIVISGASGLIGSALAPLLRDDGHEVVALVRRQAALDTESSWDPAAGTIDQELVDRADAVVNLSGASIGAKRLTQAYKREVLRSRLDSTTTIARAIANSPHPAILLQGSSMGYYGASGDVPLTESSPAGTGFLAEVCAAWETAAEPARAAGARVVALRTGLVLAGHGGFAQRLLPLIRLGVFGGFGAGTAFQSWITLDDHVRALRFLLTADVSGPVNVIAPEAVTDAAMVRALALAMHRRVGPRVPAWIIRAVVGEAAEDLLASQKGVPGVLAAAGFTWEHPTIADAAARVAASAK